MAHTDSCVCRGTLFSDRPIVTTYLCFWEWFCGCQRVFYIDPVCRIDGSLSGSVSMPPLALGEGLLWYEFLGRLRTKFAKPACSTISFGIMFTVRTPARDVATVQSHSRFIQCQVLQVGRFKFSRGNRWPYYLVLPGITSTSWY